MTGPVPCRTCGAATDAPAAHCASCGAPALDRNETSAPSDVADAVSLPSSSPTTPPPRPSWKMALPIAALVAVAVATVVMIEPEEQALVVVDRNWRRTVSVERLVPPPPDAHSSSPDEGGGSFERRLACGAATAARALPQPPCVTWSTVREAAAEGTGDAPRWPTVKLERAGCETAGCEREGARGEHYTVVFRGRGGHRYRCNFDERVWASFTPGQHHRGRLRAAAESLDCGSVKPGP